MNKQQSIDEQRKLQADEIIDAATAGRTLDEVKQIAKNWCTTALQETCNNEFLRNDHVAKAIAGTLAETSDSNRETDFEINWDNYPQLGAMPKVNLKNLRDLVREARADAIRGAHDKLANDVADDADNHSRIRSQVVAFHCLFDQPVLNKPQVPSEERVRLRLRLIAEEFFELLAACHVYPTLPANYVMDAVKTAINESAIDVDLVELADACGDLDYVVEGTRLEFGINGAPIAAEIHRSNMMKGDGGVKKLNGKIQKPIGWTKPDIEGELKKQGWVP